MNKLLVGKIDCVKIDKAKLFPGKNGAKWLDIMLVPTPHNDYGDYMIVQSVSKAERDQGLKGKILGNAKFLEKTVRGPQAVSAQDSKKEEEDSEIPF